MESVAVLGLPAKPTTRHCVAKARQIWKVLASKYNPNTIADNSIATCAFVICYAKILKVRQQDAELKQQPNNQYPND